MDGFDAAIVGGGAIGCSIALRLAKAGLRVLVLERSRPGSEASSAAAGILAPRAESEGPGPFFDLCVKSAEAYPELASELRADTGIDVAHLRCGLLEVATDPESAQTLAHRAGWLRQGGVAAESLTPAEARRLEPALGPGAIAALHLPDDQQVDNRLLVRALYAAAARAGAHFRTDLVLEIVTKGGKVAGLQTLSGFVAAPQVVAAAGAWSSFLTGGGEALPIEPVRGQMVELFLESRLFQRVIMGAGGYVVPRSDGRVIAGSTDERVGFERSVTPQGIGHVLNAAKTLVPSLREAPIRGVWTGFRPATPDQLPLLGRFGPEGLFVATGHYRNGILLTPITARLISDLVLGRPPALDLAPFSPARFQSPRAIVAV